MLSAVRESVTFVQFLAVFLFTNYELEHLTFRAS